MTNLVRLSYPQPTAVALAVFMACVSVHAQTAEQQATVSVGVGAVSGSDADRARFGQYNGLRDGGNVGLLGVEYSLRDSATNIITLIDGSNMLGGTRELDLRWKKQGDWKFSVNYGQMVHVDPNTVNTGLLGAGSRAPQVVLLGGGPGTGTDIDLKIKRTAVGVGFTKNFSTDLQLDFSAKTEDVEGARLFGRGMNCPSPLAPGCAPGTGTEAGWAVLMLPEPINANHTQLEARVSFAGEKLRISGGYYGSFYTNANGSLNPSVPATLNGPLGSPLPLSSGLQALLNQPVALPPDNQAHQIDVSGTYTLSPTTHANFKLAYATASQNEDFTSAGLSGAPAGQPSLAARVNTTRAQVGITSRPMKKLSLLANVRYEDKHDLTPIAPYNVEGSSTYTNRRLPEVIVRGKVQANYQFDSTYRGGLGANYESIDRGVFAPSSATAGISALRQKTNETGVNAELRRTMSDNFSGAISVARSRREGSNWLQDNSGTGVTEVANPATLGPMAVFMPTLADRQRDKVKFFGDWQPTEKLSLQFTAEEGRDKFTAPTQYGAPGTHMNSLGVDGSYAVTDVWSVTGYASQGHQTMNQSRPGGYVMAFDNTTITLGLGFAGKLMGKLEVGGSVARIDDKSAYAQTLDFYAAADSAALLAATGGLPDITFRQTSLKLFGKYPLDKSSSLRFDLAYLYSHLTDWAWSYNGVPFTYSDGTTVRQSPAQRASFVGLTYVYKWQ